MTVTVKIDLPPLLAHALQTPESDVGSAARELLAVSLFREGRLTHAELASALGVDRFETDALLHRHRVTDSGLTLADLEMDRAALSEVLGPVRQ